MKIRLLFAIVLSLCMLAIWAFFNNEPSEVDTNMPIITNGLNINGQKINVELALTPTEQRQGLSGRSYLPASQGMLFIYHRPQSHTFTMRGMKFPIDVLWIDQNWRVADMHENVEAGILSFSPDAPAQYVLELPAGFIEKNNVFVGDQITPNNELYKFLPL